MFVGSMHTRTREDRLWIQNCADTKKMLVRNIAPYSRRDCDSQVTFGHGEVRHGNGLLEQALATQVFCIDETESSEISHLERAVVRNYCR